MSLKAQTFFCAFFVNKNMAQEKNKSTKVKKLSKEELAKKKKAEEQNEAEEEQKGVLPNDKDFKKFLGCGG